MRKNLDPSVDRTRGELVKLNGRGLVVGGVVPLDLEIAFDAQNSERFPAASLRDWFVPLKFTEVWVFHSPLPIYMAGPVTNDITAAPSYTLILEAYTEAGAVPDTAALPDRVPQVRTGDGPLNVEDVRTGQLMVGSGPITAPGSTIISAQIIPGMRVRVHAYCIGLTNYCSSAAGGIQRARLWDTLPADTFGDHSFYIPAAPAAGAVGMTFTPWVTLGNGLVSAVTSALYFELVPPGAGPLVNGFFECRALISWERIA